MTQGARDCDTAQQRPATWRRSATTRAAARATWRAVRVAGACVAIQTLYLDWGSYDTMSGTARDTASARCDTARGGPQYGASAHQDMVPSAQPGRSVSATRVPWVCTLCTRPSFDSVHCFESLFMNTVHEVFKKKKKKYIYIYIYI